MTLFFMPFVHITKIIIMNIEGLGCGKGFGSLGVKHSLLLLLFGTKSS
jgi:hypothetical protein